MALYWRGRNVRSASISECIHGLDEERCETCGTRATSTSDQSGTMAGQTFALVYAPSLRAETFIHLNRQGNHWKFRSYPYRNSPPIELAQAGRGSKLPDLVLAEVAILHEIAYPHSSAGGHSVEDSLFWFEQIEKLNATYSIHE